MKKDVRVRVNEEGAKFYYANFGTDKQAIRLWISSKFIKKDESRKEFVKFPVRKCQLVKTDKGSYILKKGDGILYDLFYNGYKVQNSVEVEPSPDIVVEYEVQKGVSGRVSGGKLAWFENVIPISYKLKKLGEDGKVISEKVIQIAENGRVVNNLEVEVV